MQTLTLISGKGGAGKTIISLSTAKVLAEAGLRVLLIDCDIATHGATYWFESQILKNGENLLSLQDILKGEFVDRRPISTKDGFQFIPSTLSLEKDEILQPDIENRLFFREYLSRKKGDFDLIIFDCQAGYSALTDFAVSIGDGVSNHSNLVVLEADPISAASIRVLAIKLGNQATISNTRQILNKLSEDERLIYERAIGGTIYPSLPPIPFDWRVKAAFGLGEIPGVAVEDSAFGLGLLRVLKSLIPEAREKLDSLEEKFVGNWYSDTVDRLALLEEEKNKIKKGKMAQQRKSQFRRSVFLSILGMLLSMAVGVWGWFFYLPILQIGEEVSQIEAQIEIFSEELFNAKREQDSELIFRFREFLEDLAAQRNFLRRKENELNRPTKAATEISLLALLGFVFLFAVYNIFSARRRVRTETEREVLEDKIATIDVDIDRFRTLIGTDPRLKEYERQRIPTGVSIKEKLEL